MRVEITEERLSDLDEETGKHYLQERDDVITVPDSVGQKWCDHGWAKDVDGVYPTGERSIHPVEIAPDKVAQGSVAVNKGESHG